MRKTQLDAIFKQDTGPIEIHIAALAHEAKLPALAVAACTLRIEEAEPALLGVLERAAVREPLSEDDQSLLFRGLHILGGARRPAAFAPLLDLLRRPDDDLDPLLGDAITMTLPRIVAGVFDGDVAALFAAIEDVARDQFVRGALFGAATFLTWDKRIDGAAMRALLERFFSTRIAPPGDYCWVAWADAIALLGERDLAENVREACRQELVAPEHMGVEHFEQKLDEALRRPDDAGRFERAHLGYIEDVIVALEEFTSEVLGRDYVDPYSFSGEQTYDGLVGAPETNRFRDVGRNDPCPCGSGKKFKKCCLGLAQ
jgi:hypothetical protein